MNYWKFLLVLGFGSLLAISMGTLLGQRETEFRLGEPILKYAEEIEKKSDLGEIEPAPLENLL